jgi:DNA-binding NarL/FixJ family response regulator
MRDAVAVALRWLIVDDNEMFLASASRALGAQGLDVVGVASSANDALSLVDALAPDVVLVDVDLGGESGFDLAQALAEGPSQPRVVLISTYAEEDFGDLVAASPAVGFLPKSRLTAAAVIELVG